MVPLSVLDLSPIAEGSDAGQALRNSLDLARHVEALGFRRFWMAEHHNLPGIASAATAVALAHIAAGTDRIRIGAGGIMLPNHAPLIIAEQFGDDERRMVRQHDAAGADADTIRTGSDMGERHRRRRAGDPRQVVMLGHPETAKAQSLHMPREVERVTQRLTGIAAFGDRGKIKNG